MTELLALGSAVFYGSADFFGGLTARRANTVATVVVSQFLGERLSFVQSAGIACALVAVVIIVGTAG